MLHILILLLFLCWFYLRFQLQYPLVNFTSTLLCDATGVQPDVVNGKALVVMRGICDFSQKALVAQSLGATLLLLASNTTLVGQDDLSTPKVLFDQVWITVMVAFFNPVYLYQHFLKGNTEQNITFLPQKAIVMVVYVRP